MKLLTTLKKNKEIISLNRTAIQGLYNRNQELKKLEDENGFHTENGLNLRTIKQNNKEMAIKRDDENIRLEQKNIFIEARIDEMLKNFKQNVPLMQLGRILKLLDKTFMHNGKTLKLYEIINESIRNHKPFYLQYKTLIKECIKYWDDDLKQWKTKNQNRTIKIYSH